MLRVVLHPAGYITQAKTTVRNERMGSRVSYSAYTSLRYLTLGFYVLRPLSSVVAISSHSQPVTISEGDGNLPLHLPERVSKTNSTRLQRLLCMVPSPSLTPYTCAIGSPSQIRLDGSLTACI